MPLNNFGTVTPRIFRGAQPDKAALSALQVLGVSCVLKLNTDNDAEEAAACQGLFLELLRHEFGVYAGTPNFVRQVVAELVAKSAAAPVYVHCELGRDRTGLIIGAYRILIQGWTLEAVKAEMATYGTTGVFEVFDAPLVAILQQLVPPQ